MCWAFSFVFYGKSIKRYALSFLDKTVLFKITDVFLVYIKWPIKQTLKNSR